MLDMTNGGEFRWLSATDIYQMASAQKIAIFPPKMMAGESQVSDEAMDWSIKRLTEKNPSVMIFDSIADAASPESTRAILASPCFSAWAFEATIKIQQAMLYVLNYAEAVTKQHEWRIAATLLSMQAIDELDFIGAIKTVHGISAGNLTEAISIYYEKSSKDGYDYLSFANKAAAGHGVVFGVYDAYRALLRLCHQSYLSEAKKLYGGKLSESFINATSDKILKPVLDRPVADIEFNSFKIDSRIFNASVDGVTRGLRLGDGAGVSHA